MGNLNSDFNFIDEFNLRATACGLNIETTYIIEITWKDLIVQIATFLAGNHLHDPAVALNLGESASGGTGISISTLFAVDCFLN